MRHAHLGDLRLQHLLQALDQLFLGLGDFFLGLLVLLGVQLAEVQVTARHVDELLAVELGQIAHQPLVDAIGEQQHFHALLAEHFQVRAVLDLAVALAGEEIELVLTFLQATQVVGKRHGLFAAGVVGGAETQQAGDLLLVGEILGGAFLEHLAKLFPEGLVVLGLVLGELFQHVQGALGQRRLHGVDDRARLQDFAGNVQGQVIGIHHALDEAQVQRQELVGLIHDEHALHIEFQALGCFAVVQVERRAARHVEQRGVFQLALDLVVAPGQRVFEVVTDVLVELGVFLVLDLAARPGPQGAGAVDGLPLGFRRLVLLFPVMLLRQFDGQRHVVGVFLDDVAQAPAVGELFFAALQVQHDAGATLGLLHGGDFEVALALRRPVHAFGGGQAGAAAEHIHLVGNDERGIEAHAELADQPRILLLIAGEILQEVGGTGLGDGAQVRDGVLTAQADAVVFDGEGLGLLVKADANLQLGAAFEQLRLGQRLEAQLVGGVGGVGDQLAQEDFLVGIQGMDHQVQQLLHLGLEAQGFFLSFHTHRLQLSRCWVRAACATGCPSRWGTRLMISRAWRHQPPDQTRRAADNGRPARPSPSVRP